jgi:hypothetical protein
MAEEASEISVTEIEDDEYGSKERVLYKYFLQEWKLVNSLLNDIVSHGRVSHPSSVHTIRSIVRLHSFSFACYQLYDFEMFVHSLKKSAFKV